MKRKRIVAVLLAVISCATILTAGAAWTSPYVPDNSAQSTAGLITPFWVNTSIVTCDLDISGQTATCEALVKGLSGTTKITGTLTLYRQSGSSWVYVDSWTKSVSSSILSFSEEKDVSSGNSYKLIIRATVYRNNTSEAIEKESIKYCG